VNGHTVLLELDLENVGVELCRLGSLHFGNGCLSAFGQQLESRRIGFYAVHIIIHTDISFCT